MVDTRSIRQKGNKMGVTFWTFEVDHYELEESTVQYEKKCESPKFQNKQDLPKNNLYKMIEHLTKVKIILMIPKPYLRDKKHTILR
jgi:hypothetical protein